MHKIRFYSYKIAANQNMHQWNVMCERESVWDEGQPQTILLLSFVKTVNAGAAEQSEMQRAKRTHNFDD